MQEIDKKNRDEKNTEKCVQPIKCPTKGTKIGWTHPHKRNEHILLLVRVNGARKRAASKTRAKTFVWCRRPFKCVYKMRSPFKLGTPHMWQLYTNCLASLRFALRENMDPLVPSDNWTVTLSTWRSTSCSTCVSFRSGFFVRVWEWCNAMQFEKSENHKMELNTL